MTVHDPTSVPLGSSDDAPRRELEIELAQEFRRSLTPFLAYKCSSKLYPIHPGGERVRSVPCAFCIDYHEQPRLLFSAPPNATAPITMYKGALLHMVVNAGQLLRLVRSRHYNPERLVVKLPERLVVAEDSSVSLAMSMLLSLGQVGEHLLAPLPRLVFADDRRIINTSMLCSFSSPDFDICDAIAKLVSLAAFAARTKLPALEPSASGGVDSEYSLATNPSVLPCYPSPSVTLHFDADGVCSIVH